MSNGLRTTRNRQTDREEGPCPGMIPIARCCYRILTAAVAVSHAEEKNFGLGVIGDRSQTASNLHPFLAPGTWDLGHAI